jgi:hypothetical protein
MIVLVWLKKKHILLSGLSILASYIGTFRISKGDIAYFRVDAGTGWIQYKTPLRESINKEPYEKYNFTSTKYSV